MAASRRGRQRGGMRAMRVVVGVGITAVILVLGHAAENRSAASLEQERVNDERMWQLTRALLMELGYSNKVAALDAAWQKTKTPQQWASLDWSQMPQPSLTPAAQRVADCCVSVTNADIAVVLQVACRQSTDVRAITTGLLSLTQRGHRLHLQGRPDLALHFLYAAVCELSGWGQAAALIKEQLDQCRGKPFDLDDLAAGLAGAEWVRQALTKMDWLGQWASGKKDLHKNLPPLRYGVGAHSPEIVDRIREEIQAAYGERPDAGQ